MLRHRRLATLRYAHSEFQVVVPGDHVLCAVTGREIPLEELRYWNVERQEAYYDAWVSLQRHRESGPGPAA